MNAAHDSGDCPPAPHLHPVAGMVIFRGQMLVMDGRIAALIPDGSAPIADRIVELLERHGLTDVPDTAAAITSWPPPDPVDRIVDYLPEHRRN